MVGGKPPLVLQIGELELICTETDPSIGDLLVLDKINNMTAFALIPPKKRCVVESTVSV